MAVSLGFGILSIASPDFFAGFPDRATMVLHSGIVTATASALVLNVFFNVLGARKSEVGESVTGTEDRDKSEADD